jgi:hypothetical protein
MKNLHDSHLHRGRGGFSLPEVLIASGMFLTISITGMALNRVSLDREEMNSLAIGLARWLESIQRGAQRTTGGCTVTFSGGKAVTSGRVLASVVPGDCGSESTFTIGSLRADSTLSAMIDALPPSASGSLQFTPRGTVTLDDSTGDFNLVMVLKNRNLTRCVLVYQTTGLIVIGANNAGTFCSESSYEGAL